MSLLSSFICILQGFYFTINSMRQSSFTWLLISSFGWIIIHKKYFVWKTLNHRLYYSNRYQTSMNIHLIQQNTLNEFIRETYLSGFQRYWKETKSKLTSCGEVSLVHKSWMSLKNARYILIKWNHYGSRRRIIAVVIGRMAFI